MSHANMGVFWSKTDDECCDKLGAGDFTVSIVANRDKHLLGRIDIYKPFRITVSGIDIVVEDSINFVIPQSIKDEVDEKVSTRFVTQYNRQSVLYGYGSRARDVYDMQDSLLRRYNNEKKCYEIWCDTTFKWINEDAVDSKEKDKVILGERWCDKTKTVIFEDKSTFSPMTDYKKFGDNPPDDLFYLCEGNQYKYCELCAYEKECGAYLTKIN